MGLLKTRLSIIHTFSYYYGIHFLDLNWNTLISIRFFPKLGYRLITRGDPLPLMTLIASAVKSPNEYFYTFVGKLPTAWEYYFKESSDGFPLFNINVKNKIRAIIKQRGNCLTLLFNTHIQNISEFQKEEKATAQNLCLLPKASP